MCTIGIDWGYILTNMAVRVGLFNLLPNYKISQYTKRHIKTTTRQLVSAQDTRLDSKIILLLSMITDMLVIIQILQWFQI
jgi:hypothetical protein